MALTRDWDARLQPCLVQHFEMDLQVWIFLYDLLVLCCQK